MGFSGSHGFLDSGGTFTSFDFPGASKTQAYGINDSGQIVGGFNFYNPLGFLYAGGVFTGLTFPGSEATAAYDINNSGTIVGYYSYHGIHGDQHPAFRAGGP